MRTLCRPALIERDDEVEIDREIRAARWVHHRLLDFEDQHQKVLDLAADAAAPGIVRVARVLAKLRRRVRRKARSTGWAPQVHESWRVALEERMASLREARNSDPGYRAALSWDRESEPGATVKSCRRKARESDESFAERQAKQRKRSRREAWRTEVVYPARRCHWATFNALCRSVDQARSSVLSQRKAGQSSDWHRPRYGDAATLHYEPGAWRIVELGQLWWTVELCTHERRVLVRLKGGNWHPTDGCEMKTAKLTRIRNGRGWRYSISICVDIPDEAHPGTGMVALDWGHREHGHPEEHEGLRAWAWLGDDGERGVVILPAEMRAELDRAHGEQSRIDVAWEARRKAQKIPEKSRHRYRSRLDRSGVPTQEEALWLSWETRIERRIAAAKKRAVALRRETYYRAIRDLRQRYAVFAVENLPGRGQQKMDTGGMTAHRKRENRDSVARYEFLSICERFGGTILPVPARNTTRECPDCGHPCEKTSDCVIVCTSCGVARDRDHGATRNILRRGKESLAKSAAMSQNHGAAAE